MDQNSFQTAQDAWDEDPLEKVDQETQDTIIVFDDKGGLNHAFIEMSSSFVWKRFFILASLKLVFAHCCKIFFFDVFRGV